MRIVHIITRFIRGGADENTLLTCNGQAKLGHEVWLVAGDFHQAMVEQLEPAVKFLHEPSLQREPSIADLSCLATLKRTLREIQPDLVHTHESKAGILGRLAARAAGVPIIVHGVHILPFVGVSWPRSAIYLAMERHCARMTDYYISVSDEMQKLCLSRGLGRPDQHSVVPSGMDIERFRTTARQPIEQLVSQLNRPPGVPVGIIAGTLEKRKRLGGLLESIARQNFADEWILLVAGEGRDRRLIEDRIAELGLGSRIILLGYRTDLAALLASSDFVVHAAGNEGLPRVLVQAVAAGKPIVSPNLPGLSQIVRDGASGILVPVNDLDALGGEIARLVGDPGLREKLAAEARKIDLSQWGQQTMIDRIEQIYASLRTQRDNNLPSGRYALRGT